MRMLLNAVSSNVPTVLFIFMLFLYYRFYMISYDPFAQGYFTGFGAIVYMMKSSNEKKFRVTGPLCGEFTGPGEFPTQRPVTRSFDVFFDLHLNKRLSKQPWGWWFETPSWTLWRQYKDYWPSVGEETMGLHSPRRHCLIGPGTPIIKLRRALDRLKVMMGIPTPLRRHILVNRGPEEYA